MDWRWIAAAMTVVGFLLTAGNLVAAFLGVRRQVSVEETRIRDSEALAEQESTEMAARTPAEITAEGSAAVHEKYRLLYEQRGLIRPNHGNLVYLPAYEAQRIVGLTLDASRDNLLWAGIGLLVSTAASVWSLWL
ncbi:hypothetical protein AB4Z18_09375 [Leifsonia sp. 2TAF2]|uniref:hypothetical protein n=1 Tax=Leifsonia sp. 2TAF2 TaxID=3233009 RepID=UPI003F960DE1